MNSDHYSTIPIFPSLLSDVLANGSQCRFRAIGHSMYPFINDGDVIIISPLLSSPRIGDVVAFINPETGRLAIHRVIRKKGDTYLIKGDNISEAYDIVQKENILGFVTKIERNGKKFSVGLGPAKVLIAFLTRKSLLNRIRMSPLSFLLIPVRRIFRHFLR